MSATLPKKITTKKDCGEFVQLAAMQPPTHSLTLPTLSLKGGENGKNRSKTARGSR